MAEGRGMHESAYSANLVGYDFKSAKKPQPVYKNRILELEAFQRRGLLMKR